MLCSIEYLKERMTYDPASGVLFWKKMQPDSVGRRIFNTRFAGKEVGSINKDGYISFTFLDSVRNAHRFAWALYYGEWPIGFLDHRNRVRNDNRIDNLREATTSQNNANAIRNSNNRSGIKGVNRYYDKWQAFLGKDKKRHYLGTFSSKEAAAVAYAEAANRAYGEFSRSDPPLPIRLR